MTLHILHIVPALTIGGAERAVVDFGNAQAARGHRVELLVGSRVTNGPIAHLIRPEVQVHYAEESGSRFGRYPATLRWLFQHRMKVASFDVVHAHLTFSSILASFIYRFRKGARPAVIETYHSAGMNITRTQRRLAARMFAYRDALVLMAEDEAVRVAAERHGVPLSRIDNGLAERASLASDDPQVRAFRARLGLSNGTPVVGSIGRLVPARRPELLVEAFATIARGSDAVLLLIGEGPEREALAARAQALGFGDRLLMPGSLNDIRIAFGAIDLCLTVAVEGTIGLGAVEASFAGLPVIGAQLQSRYHRQPSDPLWTSADPEELGQEALRLIRSDEERKAMAKSQGKVMRSLYSIDAMAERYDRLYAEVLDRLSRS